LKFNPLGQVPTFVGADGYVLHEAIAIAIYSKQNLEVPRLVLKLQMKPCYDEKNCHTVIPVLIIHVDFH